MNDSAQDVNVRCRRRDKNSIIVKLLEKPGLRPRIDAHCVSCIYDDLVPGSWRKQVDLCTVESCPIYDVRARSTAGRPITENIDRPMDSEGRLPVTGAKNDQEGCLVATGI